MNRLAGFLRKEVEEQAPQPLVLRVVGIAFMPVLHHKIRRNFKRKRKYASPLSQQSSELLRNRGTKTKQTVESGFYHSKVRASGLMKQMCESMGRT
jgi:hypothetical protein